MIQKFDTKLKDIQVLSEEDFNSFDARGWTLIAILSGHRSGVPVFRFEPIDDCCHGLDLVNGSNTLSG